MAERSVGPALGLSRPSRRGSVAFESVPFKMRNCDNMAERAPAPAPLCLSQWPGLVFRSHENACGTRAPTLYNSHTNGHRSRIIYIYVCNIYVYVYISLFPLSISLSFSEVRSPRIPHSGYLALPRNAHDARRRRPRAIIDQRPVPAAMCRRGWWSWRWRATPSSARPRPRDTFAAEQVEVHCLIRERRSVSFVPARPVAVRGEYQQTLRGKARTCEPPPWLLRRLLLAQRLSPARKSVSLFPSSRSRQEGGV